MAFPGSRLAMICFNGSTVYEIEVHSGFSKSCSKKYKYACFTHAAASVIVLNLQTTMPYMTDISIVLSIKHLMILDNSEFESEDKAGVQGSKIQKHIDEIHDKRGRPRIRTICPTIRARKSPFRADRSE